MTGIGCVVLAASKTPFCWCFSAAARIRKSVIDHGFANCLWLLLQPPWSEGQHSYLRTFKLRTADCAEVQFITSYFGCQKPPWVHLHCNRTIPVFGQLATCVPASMCVCVYLTEQFDHDFCLRAFLRQQKTVSKLEVGRRRIRILFSTTLHKQSFYLKHCWRLQNRPKVSNSPAWATLMIVFFLAKWRSSGKLVSSGGYY